MAADVSTMKMAAFASGLVVLAIASVIGIVVLDQFKLSLPDQSMNQTTQNDTIDFFIAGIAVFGTFATILALILVAKIILGLVKGGMS